MITRYKEKLEGKVELPQEVRDELEARAKEFKQLSSDLEDVQQKLIDNIHDRSKPEQDSVASILIRNKDIADQAAAIVRSRGKFSIDGIQARNIVTLDSLPKIPNLLQGQLLQPHVH